MHLRQRPGRTADPLESDAVKRGAMTANARYAGETRQQAACDPRRCLLCSLRALAAAGVVLLCGTAYSAATARDPCLVLESWTRAEPPPLPRLFHYQGKTDALTEETTTWHRVLRVAATVRTFPDVAAAPDGGWTAVYWSDASCRALAEAAFPDFAPTYRGFAHDIQRVDACRCLFLSRYGGVYADADVSLHAASATELARLIPDGVGLVESPFRYNERWQNSLMTATAPGHAFWDVTVALMKERGTSESVLSTTGPKMIGDAVERYNEKFVARREEKDRANSGSKVKGRGTAEKVSTLPCELFQRLPSGQWDTTLLNILGRELLARAVPMRGCGQYGDGRCEITRHASKASWTMTSGKIT